MMLCRLAAAASRRAPAYPLQQPQQQQQALLATASLVVRGRPSSGAAAITATTAAPAAAATGRAAPVPSRARTLSSSTAAATEETPPSTTAAAATRKLVFGIPKEDDVVRTPPMEEEDSGPIIREMRVQVRPRGEYGSRGTRRIRRAGKVPGVVYSNSDNRGHSSRPGGGVGRPADDPILVKVDKIVLDREVRRLNASFDNTVYDLVIEGETSSGDDAADDGIEVTVADPGAGGDRGQEEEEGASVGEGGVEGGSQQQQQRPERRELVLANQSRLHPVFRTLLSVNWIRYKAGRKYPIPIKFINSDLNKNFRKGAYIRRLKTHQHILLPEDPEMVPKWLYLDLEFVRSGNKLRVSDLMMPEGILLHRANEPGMWNEVVCTIKGRKVFASGDSAGDDDDEGFVDDEA